MTTPVLYFEEVLDVKENSENSENDMRWHFCVTYSGNDTYVLFGMRNNNHFRLKFLKRSSLLTFIFYSVNKTSTFKTNFYTVNRRLMYYENFLSYYNMYNNSNEFFNRSFNYNELNNELDGSLTLLRDLRF